MRRHTALLTAVLVLAGVLALVPAPTAVGEDPITLQSAPDAGRTGTAIAVSGQGCYLPDGVTGADGLLLRLVNPDGTLAASATLPVERDGTWDDEFVVPAGLPAGDYAVAGTCIAPMYEDLGLVDGGTFTVTGPGPAPSGAEAAPSTPRFPSQIEPYPAYDGQSTCSPAAKKGMLAFRDMVMAANPGTGSFGISRDCGIGGTSEHKEGRAWDWAVNANRPADVRTVSSIVKWLLRTDEYGHRHAMARRLGIMYIIWNRRIFKLYRASDGWTAYTGSSPHTDHVHFSLTRRGGQRQTSFWTMQMPAPPPAPPPGPGGFVDVPTNAWYGPALEWAVDRSVVTGYPDQTYRPKEAVNRAQAVAWLWEQAGRPQPTATHPFSDVAAAAWYGPALSWAHGAGVVSGFRDGTYRPKDVVKRGQYAAMVWNYAQQPRPLAPHAFTDTAQHRWYSDAVAWMSAMGYLTGYPDQTYRPQEPVNRAQAVSWLWNARQFDDVPKGAWYGPGVDWARFRSVVEGDGNHAYRPRADMTRIDAVRALWQAMDRPAATEAHGFGDVAATGPAAAAVSWAVETRIVTGFPDGTFRPTQSLKRAQAVMILWSATGATAVTAAHEMTDVPDDAWYGDGLAWATEHGIASGYADGTFRAGDAVERGQMAAFLRAIAATPAAWAPGSPMPSTALP